MSMNTCSLCGDVYDTDYEMNEIADEMVCDRCWEESEAKAEDLMLNQAEEERHER